jgi:uncharacterized protein YjbI with pentapeptide repeats
MADADNDGISKALMSIAGALKYSTRARWFGIGLLVMALFLIFGKYGLDLVRIADAFYDNFISNLATVAFTVVFIDLLNEQRTYRDRKRIVIEQVGSQVNDVAREAARIVIREQWDRDGSLNGAEWYQANLQDVDLAYANLRGVNLKYANLSRAKLIGTELQSAGLGAANLHEAALEGTELQAAYLGQANLQKANCYGADLERADLSGAKLQGANLTDANLNGAILNKAHFDKATILPDGHPWTNRTDMARFTDRNRPDFWSPWDDIRDDDADSPAYHGEGKPKRKPPKQ